MNVLFPRNAQTPAGFILTGLVSALPDLVTAELQNVTQSTAPI
jgi:hypothetical protein